MPLYEYQCQQCGRRNEVLQKMADPPLTVCEVCGGPLKKLASSQSVQFKGSGWYVTDYARKSGGTAAKGEGGGESKGDTAKSDTAKRDSGAGAGESKPAASGAASASTGAGSGSGSSSGG